MGDAPEDHRAAGRAASEAGRLAEAYHLLLPLAGVGDAEAQGIVGSLMRRSLHRYESFDQPNAGTGPASDEATALADRDAGARFLEAAAAAGYLFGLNTGDSIVRGRRVQWTAGG
jgi:hypothetical protein